MAKQTIQTGTAANDGSGDTLRAGMIKANANFTELYNETAAKAAAADLTAHAANTGNPHSVTKAQVSLGNCDNTSDLDKPISTAVQAALNAKATLGQVLVTLPYELIPAAALVAPASWTLPTLPENFGLHSAYLTWRDVDVTDGVLTFQVKRHSDGHVYCSAALTGWSPGAFLKAALTLNDANVPAATRLVAQLSAFDDGYGAGSMHGLWLWLRGVWQA